MFETSDSRRPSASGTLAICGGPCSLALLALLVTAACSDPPAETEADGEGAPGMHLEYPSGEVESYDVFTWSYPLPVGGRFQVAVYDHSTGEAQGPIRRSPKLELPQWEPDPSVAERWPDQILWRVFAYDADGAPLDRGEAKAWR